MQVKNCVLRARKGMVVSGIEALSIALLLQMGRNVRRQVFNTAQEFQNRQSVLQPLLDMVSFRGFATVSRACCNVEFPHANPWHVHSHLLELEVSVSRSECLDYYLLQVGPIATHPDLEKGIWRVIDEDGSVKDSAVSLCSYDLHCFFC
jgi:hypothetical protein